MNERSFTMVFNMTDKREQILEATELLLAERGFHGLSMQMVAKQAGVAAGTIYRYFEDKDDLIEQLKYHVLARIAAAIQLNVDNDMPLQERYRTMWLNIWHLASSDCNTLLNRNQYECLPTKDNAQFRELEQKMFAKVDQLFTDGKQAGLFKPLDNKILIGLSLEASVALARKHAQGLYQLDEKAIEAAILASWDAIIKH